MAIWFAKGKSSNAQIVLLGIPLDTTVTFFPGTRFGPERIRACAEAVESYSPYFKQDLTEAKIYDTGDIELEGIFAMKAKLESIRKVTFGWMKDGSKPFLIGGEHTLTLAAVQAGLELYPDLAVLQLDSHADMRDTGETGSKLSHDTVMRRILELLRRDSLIQVGVRSFAKEELGVAGTNIFKITEREAVRRMLADRPVWLTVDLDVLDPSIMPATGSPEPNGATYQELIDMLVSLKGVKFVGADLVEFNPLAADFPAPCVLAANLVREICCLLV
jgi:agmatinase